MHICIASGSCFNTSQWKNVLPEIADAFFLLKGETRFSIFQYAACKNMCYAKGFSEIKLFLNCGKNHWWMKFNFLIKNVTCNFTKYGTPFARSSQRRYSVKKGVLKKFTNFTGKRLYWSLYLLKAWRLKACNFIKKRTQVFSCFS